MSRGELLASVNKSLLAVGVDSKFLADLERSTISIARELATSDSKSSRLISVSESLRKPAATSYSDDDDELFSSP